MKRGGVAAFSFKPVVTIIKEKLYRKNEELFDEKSNDG